MRKKTEFNHFNIISELQLTKVIRGPGAQSVTIKVVGPILEEMKYLIFSFLPSGVEEKRSVEFRR